jgi:TPR repeat protein
LQDARYYELAMNKDSLKGKIAFGQFLEEGIAVTQNYQRAAFDYKMAADDWNAEDQFRYGKMLEK